MSGLRSVLLPLSLASTLSLSACVDLNSDPNLGQDQLEIVGGTPDSGDPAVVLLELGDALCTGTLVSPRVVLTAAHCLENQPAVVNAHFINQIGETGPTVAAASYEVHPTADVGVILLSDFVDGVTPIPANQQPLENAVGQEVRIVGFGVTGENASDAGTKLEGFSSLQSVVANPPQMNDGEMATTNDPQGTCYGDSGGPNFMTFDGVEYVAGVTSRGTDACGAGEDIAVRVDSNYSWLANYIDTNDPPLCEADGRCASGCAAVDTDCCVADGACVEECGSMDADCGGSGEPDPSGDPGSPQQPGGNGGGSQAVQGGCSATGGAAAQPLWLAFLALLGGLALRRRSSAASR